MKQLTPLAELIEYADYLINEWGVDGDAKRYVLDFKIKAQSLLPKEKQGIKDSFIAGLEFIPVDPERYQEDFEQYFNETYKQ